MATTLKRQAARELSDDEAEDIAGYSGVLSGDSLLADPDGIAEYAITGAQLAMLEVEGGAVVSTPGLPAEEDIDVDYGQTIIQIGSGRAKFTARLADDTGDHEKVYVYDSDGERWPVKKANILYYRSKGFHLRPPRGMQLPDAPYSCRSVLKPHDKVFRTKMDAEDHFRTFHNREYRSELEERALMKEQRMDDLLDQLVSRSGGNIATEQLVVLMEELLSNQKKGAKGA